MVNIKSDGIEGLIDSLKDKRLICFGAGRHFDTVMNLYKVYDLASYCCTIIDNNAEICGTIHEWNGLNFKVESVDYLLNMYDSKKYVILITCHLHSMEIVRQMDAIKALNCIEVYIGSFLSDNLYYTGKYKVEHTNNVRIPKKIHYCWFGSNTIPDEYRLYIESWKHKCPEYEIKRWDETNFDINQNLYASQAYREKKWAFVSDYARIKILYEEGGIYLDCDVEMLKNFDVFLGDEFFCGFEDTNHVNFGLGFGAVKGHPLLKSLLELYNELNFINEDGTLNMTPCTAYQTETILKCGFEMCNRFQRANKIALYPTEIFAPISPWGVDNTSDLAYSIHHYTASWQNKDNMSQIMSMYREYYDRIYGK